MARTDTSRDDSGVRFPPPLYFIIGFAAGLGMERLRASPSVFRRSPRSLGIGLLVKGSLLIVWATLKMRRAGTSPEPWQPTTAIVSDGPFRLTRNPLYLGDALIYVGATLLTKSAWPLVLLPGVLAALWWRVIRKEETYLEAKFGEEYLEYKRRTRRWI